MLKKAVVGLAVGLMVAGSVPAAYAKPASLSLVGVQAADPSVEQPNRVRGKGPHPNFPVLVGAVGLIAAAIGIAASSGNGHTASP